MSNELLLLEQNRRYADVVFSDHSYGGTAPSNFPDRIPYVLTDRSELNRLSPGHGQVIRDLSGLTDQEVSQAVFYIYFTYDSDALPLLKEIKSRGGIFISASPVMDPGAKTTYCHGINRLAHQALVKTWNKREKVSHLNLAVHQNICEALDITQHLEGDFVEFGVYMGGSALTAMNFIDEMSDAGKMNPRHCWLLDTFDGFTYEEAQNSIDPLWKNTHRLSGVEQTQKNISEALQDNKTPYSLHVNNICRDMLPEGLGRVVVANVDVDMYEPTLTALYKISDHVVPGGIILCEDPPGTPALYGALLAMEEFLDSDKGKCYTKIFKGGQYFLVKRT